MKKRRWCAWDSNPGPQDGSRIQNHVTMTAAIRCGSNLPHDDEDDEEEEGLKAFSE